MHMVRCPDSPLHARIVCRCTSARSEGLTDKRLMLVGRMRFYWGRVALIVLDRAALPRVGRVA